jgi:hypothetical protein
MVKARFLDQGMVESTMALLAAGNPPNKENSHFGQSYIGIYIHIYIEVVMFLSFEDFFQRPVTTNGGFDVSGQVYDVACISLGPCGHEDGAKPRQYAIQQFSQPFF